MPLSKSGNMSIKSTPCSRRLRRRFASSHSNPIAMWLPQGAAATRPLCRLAQEAVDAVRVRRALDLSLADQIMQMRQRLAERETGLVPVERAAPQDRHHVGGTHRKGAGVQHLGAALVMVRGQLVDA